MTCSPLAVVVAVGLSGASMGLLLGGVIVLWLARRTEHRRRFGR